MTPGGDPSISLDDQEALKKLLEEGVDHGMQSMAKLTRVKWEVTSVSLTDGPPKRFLDAFAKSAEKQAGVRVSSKDPFPMEFLLIFSPKSSSALTGSLTQTYQVDLGADAEARRSVLEEVGNILVSSFLKKLANSIKTTIMTTPPTYSEGNKKELLSAALAAFGEQTHPDGHVVMAHIGMCSSRLLADFDLLILAEPECLNKMVELCA